MKSTMNNMAGQAVNSSTEDHKIGEYIGTIGTMKAGPEEESPEKSRRTKASSKKEALTRIFAQQEMVNSLLGNQEDGNEDDTLRSFNNALAEQGRLKRPSASKPKKKRNDKTKIEELPQSSEGLADLYYARMAGEEYVDALDALDSSSADPTIFSKRSQMSASRSEGSDATTSPISCSSSCSIGTDESGELSVDVILEHVLASIPKQVRDEIPEEMWKQILGQQGSCKASQSESRSGPARNSMHRETKAKENAASNLHINGIPVATKDGGSIEEDEISVTSDLTGFGFPAETVPLIADDINEIDPSTSRWDAICPTVAPHAPGDMDPFDENDDSPFSDKPRSTKRNNLNESENLKALPRRSKIPSETGKRGSVKFDQVEVRHYERIASDNPSVQSGPAIGIGWRFAKGGHVDINDWELRKSRTRKSAELVLARAARERILMEAGCTKKEIADMIRVSLKVKNQRITTLNNLSAAGMEESVEAARKKIAGLLRFGREKKVVKNK
jgi:hypothetical protein